ncbi:hypothetical protein BH20VER1_BH20VER1_00600 [soil metagenome]
MQKEEIDLRERTKEFALRIVRMFSSLPKTTEAQILGKQEECDELTAIFVTILKRAKER